MERFKRMCRKLLFPKWWITLCSVPIAAAGLFYVFAGEPKDTPVAYCVYVFSFCSLTWACALLVRLAGHWREALHSLTERLPLVKRYMTDVPFRMNVSLYRALGMNVFYALYKLGLGVYYRSAWFVTLAVYYFLLAVMRFSLLHYARGNRFGENPSAEWKRYRLCAGILLGMTLALTGMVILVVVRNEGFSYAGYLIYVMALYAFYNVATAVKNVIAYRRFRSPVMSAAKVLNLAAALVSILALETAMLSQFGGNEAPHFREIMSGCTGAGVCVAILAIAIYMLHHAAGAAEKLNKEETI